MKIAVFGLTISSSWGNGHATLWRGLCAALARQGHRVVFFEHDTPYYAGNRDLFDLSGGDLVLYDDWESIRFRAKAELADADAAIVTSYCPDAVAAADLIFGERCGLSVFYDLDTPVTLSRLRHGEAIPYIGGRGLADFDLVLSYTGGLALDVLRRELGARRVVPLYGHVDPQIHRPVEPKPHYRCDLSYLGTYSADRQDALAALLIVPARRFPERRFLIGGAQYPQDFPWCHNLYFVRHLPPSEHPAFFSSSRLTLNVTRAPMAQLGWCPSGRLFEAASCGAAILSDTWEGLDAFFTPGQEIFTANDSDGAMAALDADDADIRRVAAAARERTLAQHTSECRARELIAALEARCAQSSELEGV
ncbi:MAG TPA: glycosyltransferase [Xanthobacteraceae bacterium]|jgi:spore maturation protein CgeB